MVLYRNGSFSEHNNSAAQMKGDMPQSKWNETKPKKSLPQIKEEQEQVFRIHLTGYFTSYLW